MIIELPPFPIPSKIKWTLKQPTQVNRGEFTGSRRVTILSAAPRWSADVEYPPIVGEHNIRPWRAALARLQGQANPFKLYAAEHYQKTMSPSVVVDGAGQQGTMLATRGWFRNSYISTGNFISVGGRLLQVLSQTIIDQNGKGVIEVLPFIPEGLADGEPIETVNPYALMSLTDDTAGWTVDVGEKYTISFSCEEAF